MAFLNIPNVSIVGVAACVPSHIDENKNYPIEYEDRVKLITTIGVDRKRIADNKTCSSDLCYKAADKLIEELKWNKNEIDSLIFVSQTPDYHLPATSCILQHRLGLNSDCYALDISLGCSGWVYGLSTISSLISTSGGSIRKALLLAGDTISKITSYDDKSTWPLFGDAGTATAVEYMPDSSGFKFHLATDGEGAETILVKDGGYRNPVTIDSFQINEYEGNNKRNDLQLILDGMNVFSFAISKAPQSVNCLIDFFSIEKENIDYFTFHQANFFLNEKIRKKLKLEPEKVPYSLQNYGNTSCATIPLTMVTEIQEELRSKKLNHISCAFGVGLSWGSVYFITENIICPELIEY